MLVCLASHTELVPKSSLGFISTLDDCHYSGRNQCSEYFRIGAVTGRVCYTVY